VIDGGHHWNVWSNSIAKAMVYMLKPQRALESVARN
jgi:enterochelin esterase-like enzyme